MELNFPFKMGHGIEKLLPSHVSKECINLMNLLLTYDPEKRITAAQALQHPYFKDYWEFENS